jgi:thiol-disulfide isomerase/thioredoxin
MKNSLILGSVLLFTICSCQKSKIATLSGKIEQYGNAPLLIADYKITNAPDTIKLIDGKFSTELQTDQPGFKYFLYENNRKELFLMTGTSLKITFNKSNVDSTLKFEGKGATENIVLDSISKYMQTLDYRFAYTQPVEIACKYVDSINAVYKKHFMELTKTNMVSSVFKELEEASIDYNLAALKAVIGLRNDIKDTSYYSFLKKLNPENEKHLDIPSYRMFLQYYISVVANEILEKENNSNSESQDVRLAASLAAIEKIKNKNIQEYLLFDKLNLLLNYQGSTEFDKYREYFQKKNTNPVYAKEIEKNYTRKLLLAPGKPAPSFTCIGIDNKNYSLKDFKGQYVYVDFWATWCSPCMQELPEYLKLKSDYKGKNITFVSISFDRDKNSWERVVNEGKNEGVNLFEEKGWDSDVAKAYQISGIPTFVLIDKEGNFIDSQAPRPSTKEIRKVLDELLTKE